MRQLTLLSLYVSISKSNPKFYIMGSNTIWSRIWIPFFRRFQEAFLIFATFQMSTVNKSATWNLKSKKNKIRFHKDLGFVVLNSTLATMWKSRYLSCGEPIFNQQQSNDTSRIKAKDLTTTRICWSVLCQTSCFFPIFPKIFNQKLSYCNMYYQSKTQTHRTIKLCFISVSMR